jgi:hypothetical protein
MDEQMIAKLDVDPFSLARPSKRLVVSESFPIVLINCSLAACSLAFNACSSSFI